MDPTRLLLHPVRLRIVNAVLDGHEFTTAELGRRLPEVSKATLYRQLSLLVAGDLVRVVDERRVRGGVERSYRISSRRPLVTDDDLSRATTREHRALMANLATTMMAEFDTYLADVEADIRTTSYRQYGLWLTDDERDHLSRDVEALVGSYASRTPGPGRRRHLLTVVLFPSGPPGPSAPAGPDSPLPDE